MMQAEKIESEIARVEIALANTSSKYLAKDYGKYLVRLKKMLKSERRKECR